MLYMATNAQIKVPSNKIIKKIAVTNHLINEQKKIVPNSFFIKDVDSSFYFFNYATNTITWLKTLPKDSIDIVYRVFNFSFNTYAYRYNYDSIKDNFIAKPIKVNHKNNDGNSGFFGNQQDIQYNGSFGRSLSFGNNQSAIFNSQLNLQINGMLGDSIAISAAITDNNLPIQPDGTTQQLNEFDKILIQFKKKNWQIDLGDIDIRYQDNYFLNFYKRLQGAAYKKTNTKGNHHFSIAGAIAKGKFVRNVFQGLEGNQGPYRLKGNNNEFFLMVLANTERVFIDGELLQRGEDQDYIINYNTAEITFTPKQLITKDTRIQVEFEYADRNYLNYMLFASDEIKVNKQLKINIAAYSNIDAKNSPINQQLDAQQKQFLANIGDSIDQAFYPSAILDSFSTTKILYAKRVNPVNPLWDSVYVYSTHPDSAKYLLNFVEVGINKGNYLPLFNGANGKVYYYVPPINGIKQGLYEPAIFLATPKQQHIITLSTVYAINNSTTLATDVALSNYNSNTFSSKSKQDNTGFAGKFLLEKNGYLKQDKIWTSSIGYEFVDDKFKTVERLRSVEFARDWGLPILLNYAKEHLPTASFAIKNKTNNNYIGFNIHGYFRSDEFNAIKNQFILTNQFSNNILLNLQASRTDNKTLLDKGNFTKINVELSKTFKNFKNYQTGINYTLESNIQKNKLTDSITPLSFSLENIGAYIKSDIHKSNRWSLQYFTRKNKLPYQLGMLQTDRSHNIQTSLELLKSRQHQFKFNVSYRELIISNNFLTNLKADKTLLGRAEYFMNKWNGFITGTTLYELGTGQEQRRDFSFIEVPAGRGEYAWIDYNADGIPQLNEFEIALYSDQAKYIRIYTPTNEYIKAAYVQFNYAFTISPKALFKNNNLHQWQHFVAKFMLQSSMQINKKMIADGTTLFNPFSDKITDTALISLQQNTSNTISFNRFSSKWGADITNIQNISKALLTYGFESRKRNEWNLRARINFKKQYTFELINKLSNISLLTPKFNNRNYTIKSYSIEPKLSYTYLTKYRLQLSYLYTNKQNAIVYGGEKAISNILQAEAKLNVLNNTSLLAKMSMHHINFTGNTGTTVSYIMLDALLPGKNYLWTIELTKRLGNNLELTINYEGRKPANTPIIHIGRAGIRALL